MSVQGVGADDADLVGAETREVAAQVFRALLVHFHGGDRSAREQRRELAGLGPGRGAEVEDDRVRTRDASCGHDAGDLGATRLRRHEALSERT